MAQGRGQNGAIASSEKHQPCSTCAAEFFRMSLTDLYDEKTCHEAHSFTHNHKDIKIFRIRRSAIRAYFIYYSGKIIILIKTKTKRSDKLSKGDKEELETIARIAIEQINLTGFHQRIVV